MSKISDSVYTLAKPYADEFSLELVEVQYKKEYNGMNLTLVIDKEGGVTVEDCEKLHRAIDLPLDELDPTEGKGYILNVSSPGLDRPLTLEWDFKRNLNKQIEVKLFSAVDSKKVFKGILTTYSDTSLTIKTDDKEYTFEKNKTAKIVPVIEF